ncbi:cAMP-binding proteins-catabolite gene activator and regulatory subunit of cAMP-dependent protein kinases [Candidatus Terasakiella magnetica]|uniref:cAMP-binding proteins-catabolite gene activator and regulatory subunit of cAMP-dependent protein kinases n=1 Tax=Candidatus Terasakiella magnetica TaxID=1867952 RepID=A0A1C3RKA9_9PROT|nr:Crp/Fnr family transcriptional regulator [Candidatus Terasakiella magnetica]SCA57651.1 cAMP-binding proteins-catabolite gene activator and regulatory subunit of cAMP-dependent protein kinases [Candidatus Terasakiella magnetica]
MSKSLTPDVLDEVSEVLFFHGLPRHDLEELLQSAVLIEEAKGSLLFSQGDKADRFYIILSGRVKLFTANEEGEESIVEVYNAPNSFAEAAMFASARFPVNCETVLPSRLVRIEGAPFLKNLKANPNISKSILMKLATRYRDLQGEIIQLKTQSPAQRLGTLFLSLIEDSEGGAVELPYDKHLIAARVGMKPESLSRALTRLRDLGVDCQKSTLHVADVEKLRAFCQA